MRLAAGAPLEALEAYLCGADALQLLHESAAPLLSGRLLEAVRLLRRDLHNNAAQACLALERWEEAAECAGVALEVEPANVKALFRRATARVSAGDAAHAAQARADLEAVCELQPRNAAAQSLLRSPMLSGT